MSKISKIGLFLSGFLFLILLFMFAEERGFFFKPWHYFGKCPYGHYELTVIKGSPEEVFFNLQDPHIAIGDYSQWMPFSVNQQYALDFTIVCRECRYISFDTFWRRSSRDTSSFQVPLDRIILSFVTDSSLDIAPGHPENHGPTYNQVINNDSVLSCSVYMELLNSDTTIENVFIKHLEGKSFTRRLNDNTVLIESSFSEHFVKFRANLRLVDRDGLPVSTFVFVTSSMLKDDLRNL